MKPPATVTMRFCPECGRDDRRHNLPDSHVTPLRRGKAKGCGGSVSELLYELPAPAPTRARRKVSG